MQSSTHKSKQEMKQHDDALKSIVKPAQSTAPKRRDPVPLPEHGAHPHSYAAHLGNPMHERTTPAGNLRKGASGGQLREPPQQISRIGKQHRGG